MVITANTHTTYKRVVRLFDISERNVVRAHLCGYIENGENFETVKRYKYSGSNNIDDVAWFLNNSNGSTQPIGTKQPNELGLYDMSGNVWEWCSDWLGFYNQASLQTNPAGPSQSVLRVLRGGGWNRPASRNRVAARGMGAPDANDIYTNWGIRLVLP